MSESNKIALYKSIASFLDKEIKSGSHPPETTESLEVAKECIETAFHFSTDSKDSTPDLLTLFELYSQTSTKTKNPEPNEQDVALAEMLKSQGNICMKEEKFDEAVACYTKALELSPSNAIFYCNRAAAYSRLNEHEKAIADCKRALEIDPQYSKAYGRMGMAYSSMGDHARAVDCYRKGTELDPNNINVRQNLTLAEEKLRNASKPKTSSATASSFLDSMDFSDPNIFNRFPGMQEVAQQLMSAPETQNLARQFMNDPNAQTMLNSFIRGMYNPPDDTSTVNGSSDQTGANANSQNTPGPMDALLRFGQQMAQQLQSSNPELVDQLRQSFQSSAANNNANLDKDNDNQ